MKILKNDGKFTVLSKPEDVINSIATAARTCYQSQDKSSPENDIKLVKNLITRGHTSMLEFADITVRFDNVSRGFTHELVRHRIASFAQESTRYVDEKDFEVVVPPHKDENESHHFSASDLFVGIGGNYNLDVCDWLESNERMYKQLRKDGWKPEDARQILPTALNAQIVIKTNCAEWRHIFFRRCDEFAHWEIRKVMVDLLKWCKQNIPVIFDDFYIYEKNGIEYAKRIMSKQNILKEIEFYNLANPDNKIELKI